MLKNVSPIVSGPLLRALDETPHGAWIAIVSGEHEAATGIRVEAESVEEVVSAVLAVTALDPDAPIVVEGDSDLSDIAFAVTGLASDAEGHRVDALAVSRLAFCALLTESRVTVMFDSDLPFGFLLLKGRC